MDKLPTLLKFFTFVFLISYSICLVILFFVAWLNPFKSVIVYIDRFGEANLEFILIQRRIIHYLTTNLQVIQIWEFILIQLKIII